MDTKLDKLVANDTGKTLKKSHRSYQKVLTIYVIFIHLRIAPLILHRATIRLLFFVNKRKGAANINIPWSLCDLT